MIEFDVPRMRLPSHCLLTFAYERRHRHQHAQNQSASDYYQHVYKVIKTLVCDCFNQQKIILFKSQLVNQTLTNVSQDSAVELSK